MSDNNIGTAIKEKLKKVKQHIHWPLVKRILGTLLVLAGLIFILVNYKACYNAHKTRAFADPNAKLVKLKSNSVIKQNFLGRDGELKKIGLCMDNMGMEKATGSVTVTIYHKGKEICTDTVEANMIETNKFAWFRFLDRPETEEDEVYTAVFKLNNFKNAQGFGVYVSGVYNPHVVEAGDIDGTKTLKTDNVRIRVSFAYYDYVLFIKMALILLIGVILIWLPYGRIQKFIKKKTDKEIDIQKWISRLFFVTTPLTAYFIMELLSKHTMSYVEGKLLTVEGWFNLMIYAIILAMAYAITNRTQYASIITWTLTLVVGMTNYFVTQFRGVPILVQDIMSIGTAKNVAAGYVYEFDMWILWGVALFAASAGLMLGLKPYKGVRLKFRIIPVVIGIAAAIFGYWFFVQSEVVSKCGIEDSQWKPQLTYRKNGTALSFITSWKYIKTEKPKGYSVDKVKELTKDYKSDKTSKANATKKKMPNIICIMNESLADFTYDGELKTTEDYMPYLRALKKDAIRGQLYVSIEGANTANSEFEFLTGNNMAFFAPRAVPYNNLLSGKLPSLTRTLKMQGYSGCNAYHPYKRDGWNRPNVYSYLGFDNFYSEEHYKNAKYTRAFVSDASDMRQIIKDFEAEKKKNKAPYYQFNVTVQNHGGYVGQRGKVNVDVKVTTSGLSTEENNQYMTLVKQSDDAFKELVEHYKKEKEPTIILMFGDHQPPLVEQFYETLFKKKQSEFTTEDTANWYSTPYVIWANYDIKEKENENMSCNYLSSYLLNMIGADMTGYNKYLLNLRKKLPVVTAMFYKGDDGKFYDVNEKSKYSKDLNEYSIIQYNGLFDQKNRVDDFFFLKGGDYYVEPKQEFNQ